MSTPVSQALPARPTGHEEAWRFTPVSRLAVLYDGELSNDAVEVSVEASMGVSVSVAGSVASVTVPAGTPTDEPIVVTVTGRDGRAGTGSLAVTVAANTTATVVIRYAGTASYASDLAVTAGDGSSLALVVVHEWDAAALHLDNQHLTLGRDATVTATSLTVGGGLVRLAQQVSFAGPGADVTLSGLMAAGAAQHLEHRSVVAHHEPHCRSRVVSKAVLAGDKAHTVWVGDVLIGSTATGTDTYETNRNLVLVDGARADSVPNLEIETGEIAGAGHASATGRFDEEQLFYLASRGIPEDVARRLVVAGFLAEVLDPIAKLPGLRDLHSHLAGRLSAIVDGGSGAAS
jgi:Fe-S cluster assembly protein SufD